MNLRWFVSRTVREASELRKQVWIVLNHQRDVLPPKPFVEVSNALNEFDVSLKASKDDQTLKGAADRLEKIATQWLKPYPNAGYRENFKEFLASAVLIMTIFNFFFQPMKIPSGSAQPTLYGNVVTSLGTDAGSDIPPFWGRVADWFRGIDYHQWVAQSDGVFKVPDVETVFGFVKRQRFVVGEDSYTVWFPPDHLVGQCGVHPGQPIKKGETVFRLRILNGDRLFVDRLTYNFRRPERGETIVFTSTGIPGLIQDTHYIKRLIGLSGDEIRIGNDRHVIVNGQRLDASTPHFENVYTFSGPPQESVYSGHVNDSVSREVLGRGIAPLFPDEKTPFIVRPGHYLAFGDNTLNSHDGRAWGDFPREKVIGKALFVFWPLSSRFGPVNR